MEEIYAVDGIEDGFVRLVRDADDFALELPVADFIVDAKAGWIVAREASGAFRYLEAQTKERQAQIRARLNRLIGM